MKAVHISTYVLYFVTVFIISKVHFSILPNSKHQVSYNFVPLLPGNHTLPRLHVNMLRYPGTMDDVIARMLPATVFVMVCKHVASSIGFK